jgi:glycosyltransferase involved in cell wall biosynthesis
MDNSIIISYLVPSYNHENYLPTLLEGLIQDIQTLNVRTEILILDDGSIDNSPQIIKDWAQKNAHCLEIRYSLQENKGITFVFNRLIEQSEDNILEFVLLMILL